MPKKAAQSYEIVPKKGGRAVHLVASMRRRGPATLVAEMLALFPTPTAHSSRKLLAPARSSDLAVTKSLVRPKLRSRFNDHLTRLKKAEG